MQKCSTLVYLVDNRNLFSSECIDISAFHSETDIVINRLFNNVEFAIPNDIVSKTLKRVNAS